METLTPDALRSLADAIEAHDSAEAGDGEAVFFSDMTEEEYDTYKREDVDGWREFMDKVRNPEKDNA